jgi:hypothetical protein
MAKSKSYYYECVYQVDVAFMAPDHRKERWPEGSMQPPMLRHSLRFNPAKYEGGMGDILVVSRPLARHFTEPIKKTVKRRNLRNLAMTEYKEIETESKVKFRLLDPDEIGDIARKRARRLDLIEEEYLQEEVHAVS